MKFRRLPPANKFKLLPPSQRQIERAIRAGVEPLTKPAIDHWLRTGETKGEGR